MKFSEKKLVVQMNSLAILLFSVLVFLILVNICDL